MNARMMVLMVAGLFAQTAGAISIPNEVDNPRVTVIDSLSRLGPVHDVVMGADGWPRVVYLDRDGALPNEIGITRVRYARYDGWTWRDETLGSISEREDAAVNRAITLAVSGGHAQVLVVESMGPGTQDDRLVRFHLLPDQSVTRQIITTGVVTEPTIAYDAPGNLYVAWHRIAPFVNGIEAGTLADDGTFTASPLVTSGTTSSPSLASRVTTSGGIFGATLGWNECDAMMQCHQRAAFIGPSSVADAGDITAPGADGNGHVRIAIGTNNMPEAMIVTGPVNQRRIEMRRYDGSDWPCINTGACAINLSEAIHPDYVPAPHAFARAPVNSNEPQALIRALSVRLVTRSTIVRERNLVPNTFIDLPVASHALDPVFALGSLGIDRDGRALAVGVTDDEHRDLVALKIDGSWRGGHVPNSTAVTLQTGLALTTARDGTPILLGTIAGGGMRLLRWTGSGNDFVNEALPAGLDADEASMLEAPDFGLHVALHDRNGNNLVYAYRPGASNQPWQTLTLDSVGDSGRSPTIVRYADGTIGIVALDGDGRVVLWHRAALGGNWSQRALSSLPAPGAAAAPRAAVMSVGFLLRVSWFSAATNRLMLSTLTGDPADAASTVLIESTISTGATPQGRQHDLVLLGDGQPMIAYTVGTTSQNLEVRYRHAATGQWLTVAEPPTQLDTYLGLRLSVAGDSPFNYRLAYVERRASGDRLWALAPDNNGGMIASNFGTPFFADPARPMIALHGRGRTTLAVAEQGGANLFRLQEPDPGPTVFAALPPGASGATQSLPENETVPVCACLQAALQNIECEVDNSRPRAALSPLPGETLTGLQARFSNTQAGRYYLDLFQTHSNEIMALTLSEPTLLAERWRTWQDLLPGFRALLNGQGDTERFTPERIAAARGVLQGWADHGSPQLRAAVEGELSRLNDLQVFSGLTFDEWFEALTPGQGSDAYFNNGFESAVTP